MPRIAFSNGHGTISSEHGTSFEDIDDDKPDLFLLESDHFIRLTLVAQWALWIVLTSGQESQVPLRGGPAGDDDRLQKTLLSDFPHESSVDQWFSESQFDSYRKLGIHSVLEVFDKASSNKRSLGRFF